MSSYYVNKTAQPTGEHEVHKEGCTYLPSINNRIYLGDFISCKNAVEAAKLYFSNVDGCYTCSRDCHTK